MARFNLPDIDFIELDVEDIEMTIVTRFEELSGITLGDSDPRRKFIQAVAYAMAIQLNNIDYTAKQNLLAYAEDDFLDHYAAQKNIWRIAPSPSITTIRFEVNPMVESIISNGTRVAANDVIFATTEDVKVSPGMTSVDVLAQCTEVGDTANGFLPNQIKDLIDPHPSVIAAYNISTSQGGANWEDDDSFAERIRQSNESFSAAGPSGAYEFFAKSANQMIVDVLVSSPSDGVVEIRPLLQNGEIPGEEILNQVLETCSDRSVRPLTDKVIATAPEEITYDLDITYFISQINHSIVPSIQIKIEDAIQNYLLWQKSKLGRGIDIGECISMLKSAGAKRVIVNSPTSSYIPIEEYQVAKVGVVNVQYGGVVNE